MIVTLTSQGSWLASASFPILQFVFGVNRLNWANVDVVS